MPPTKKRARDIKCVIQAEGRKRIKSASPEDAHYGGPGETYGGPGETNGRLLACPYFKHSPTMHMDCLLRNRLTSTSFVRQHLQRVHLQPIHCPTCGTAFKKEEKQKEHVRQKACRKRYFMHHGLDADQLRQIRNPLRGMDERERWNHMWKILFSNDPLPDEPYVGTPQDEILGITRRAMEAEFPNASPALLQFLNWDSVSTTCERGSLHMSHPIRVSHGDWPPTPQSADGDAFEGTLSERERAFRDHGSTKVEPISTPLGSTHSPFSVVAYPTPAWEHTWALGNGEIEDNFRRPPQQQLTPLQPPTRDDAPDFRLQDILEGYLDFNSTPGAWSDLEFWN